METLSETLVQSEEGYSFYGESLLEPDSWMMLINDEGRVVWSYQKPDDVPGQYSISDVASFTRWYLNDYPVYCWVREEGLLVRGSPKGSIWKHDITMQTSVLLQMPLWFLGFFLLALGVFWDFRILRCADGFGAASKCGMPRVPTG